MDFNIDVNPEEMLLGLYFCNGETEFGEDVRIYSLGLIFLSINLFVTTSKL